MGLDWKDGWLVNFSDLSISLIKIVKFLGVTDLTYASYLFPPFINAMSLWAVSSGRAPR